MTLGTRATLPVQKKKRQNSKVLLSKNEWSRMRGDFVSPAGCALLLALLFPLPRRNRGRVNPSPPLFRSRLSFQLL